MINVAQGCQIVRAFMCSPACRAEAERRRPVDNSDNGDNPTPAQLREATQSPRHGTIGLWKTVCSSRRRAWRRSFEQCSRQSLELGFAARGQRRIIFRLVVGLPLDDEEHAALASFGE